MNRKYNSGLNNWLFQSKSPPMSISYSSWAGGGGGGGAFLPFASLPASFPASLGASFPFLSYLAAGA